MSVNTANVWKDIEIRKIQTLLHTMSDIFNEQKGYIQKYIKSKFTFQVDFYGYHSINSTKTFDKQDYLHNYLLTVDAYTKIPKLYGKEIITTEKVMYKLYMFQSIFGKIDGFGCWDLEIISTDADTQFTSTYL